MTRAMIAALLAVCCAASCFGALEVHATAYVPDAEFPELLQYFREGWGIVDEIGQPRQYTEVVRQGAYLHAIVRNTGGRPVEAERVLLQGIDLAEQLAPRHRETRGVRAASFLLNDEAMTPTALRERLEACGSPVWWMVRPAIIPPGGFAETIIRLRDVPERPRLRLDIDAGGERASMTVNCRRPADPMIVATALDDGMDRLFVVLRGEEDFEVGSLAIDGEPAHVAAPDDLRSARGVLPLEAPLRDAWAQGSFHCVMVRTTDGRVASTVMRAREPFLALGMWGYRSEGTTQEEIVRDYLEPWSEHLFNVAMPGSHRGLLESAEGEEILRDYAMKIAAGGPGGERLASGSIYARFLLDEPDVSDYYVDELPWTSRVGCYAQGLVERQREWTRSDPQTLALLNVDMTFKPENWFSYGQLPDILAVDPYYQSRLRDAWWSHPARVKQFVTPYYVFAVSEIARCAAQPKPLHVILNSVSFQEDGRSFRYGTPEEKRVEFYHALAAGARAISYWWFTPYGRHVGCGARDPDAFAMMQEFARLNRDALSVADLLTRGCPAHAPGEPDPFVTAQPQWLMPRTLMCGIDAAIVVLVNRDHASDRQGSAYAPIPTARLSIDLPPWLEAGHALRLTEDSIEPVEFEREADTLTFELADVQLTELLILADRESIVQRVRARWEALAPQVEAITGRTYDQWLAGREALDEERARRIEEQREELFTRYAALAERGQWLEASDRLGTYGAETERTWNPTDTRYNAQTWWVASGEVTDEIVRGLRWEPPNPGRWRVAVSYQPKKLYRLRVVSGAGEVLDEMTLEPQVPDLAAVADWTTTIPEGAALEFVQRGADTTGEMWGKVSPMAIFVPGE